MAYVAQLLPDEEQAEVLNAALREYAEKYEGTPSHVADELRLDLLKQMRRKRNG